MVASVGEGSNTAGGKSESSPPAVQFLHVRGHRTARNQPAQRGNQQEGCCSRLGSPLRDASWADPSDAADGTSTDTPLAAPMPCLRCNTSRPGS